MSETLSWIVVPKTLVGTLSQYVCFMSARKPQDKKRCTGNGDENTEDYKASVKETGPSMCAQ